jgi:hypothetical protein
MMRPAHGTGTSNIAHSQRKPFGHRCKIGRVAGHRGEAVAPSDRLLGSAEPAPGDQRRSSPFFAALPTPRVDADAVRRQRARAAFRGDIGGAFGPRHLGEL